MTLRAVARSAPATGGGGGVTSVAAGVGLLGGTITSAGTISLQIPVSLSNGGTGATSASAALTSLGAVPLAGNVTMTGPLTLSANAASALQPTTLQQMNAAIGAAGIPGPSTVAPLMDGVAVVGTSTLYTRQDHVHPTDTSRAPIASPTFTGTVTIPAGASIAGYAPLASPTFTGVVTIPAGANIAGYAPIASPVFTGTPQAPTVAAADNSVSIATTAWVKLQGYYNSVGRNALHNSMFNVQQRGQGPWTTGQYTVDRWRINASLDTLSVSVVAQSDAGRSQIGDEASTYALAVAVNGNAGATAYTAIAQPIEDLRRLAGKTVTFSFWAYTGTTGKIGINLLQSFGTGGSPSAGGWVQATGAAVTIGTTWTRYSATFVVPTLAGKTLGTNNDHATVLWLWFSSGTTNNVNAGNIGVQSFTADLWGMQLEVGSVATPLEKPDPQQDLAKCQRFYQVGGTTIAGGVGGAAFPISFPWALSVPMRATPTITTNFTTNTNVTGPGVFADSNAYVRMYGNSTASGSFTLGGTYTASADL